MCALVCMRLLFVCASMHACALFVMPCWAEPQRHTVVGVCVCVNVCMYVWLDFYKTARDKILKCNISISCQ